MGFPAVSPADPLAPVSPLEPSGKLAGKPPVCRRKSPVSPPGGEYRKKVVFLKDFDIPAAVFPDVVAGDMQEYQNLRKKTSKLILSAIGA